MDGNIYNEIKYSVKNLINATADANGTQYNIKSFIQHVHSSNGNSSTKNWFNLFSQTYLFLYIYCGYGVCVRVCINGKVENKIVRNV